MPSISSSGPDGSPFPSRKAQVLFQEPATSQHRLHAAVGEGGKEASLQAAGKRPLSRKEVNRYSVGAKGLKHRTTRQGWSQLSRHQLDSSQLDPGRHVGTFPIGAPSQLRHQDWYLPSWEKDLGFLCFFKFIYLF